MKSYSVPVTCTVEVTADSDNDAVSKAADMFAPIIEKLEAALGTGSDISRVRIAVPFRELATITPTRK